MSVGELESRSVGELYGAERRNDLVLESSKVLGLESCMGGLDLGKGQGV